MVVFTIWAILVQYTFRQYRGHSLMIPVKLQLQLHQTCLRGFLFASVCPRCINCNCDYIGDFLEKYLFCQATITFTYTKTFPSRSYRRRNLWNCHVVLDRVQQTVSGNTVSQHSPDTISFTLFRCSLRLKPYLANRVWRHSTAIFSRHDLLDT